MSSRAALIVNGLCALLLGWLYGGDALDALRAQTAEVSAYLEPPNLGFAVVALLGTGLGVAATLLGAIQKRPPAWRGFRLMPIVTVVVLFLDLFVLSASRSPLSSADRTALTIQTLAEAASSAATTTAVPNGPRELQTMAEQFGPPPYLVQGQPLKAWTVSLRQGCEGPVTEVKGEPVGTLFYCASKDLKQAWVSAVGLPLGTFFGPPQLFGRGGEPVVGLVHTQPPEEAASGATQEAPPEGPEAVPQPFETLETPDSGR